MLQSHYFFWNYIKPSSSFLSICKNFPKTVIGCTAWWVVSRSIWGILLYIFVPYILYDSNHHGIFINDYRQNPDLNFQWTDYIHYRNKIVVQHAKVQRVVFAAKYWEAQRSRMVLRHRSGATASDPSPKVWCRPWVCTAFLRRVAVRHSRYSRLCSMAVRLILFGFGLSVRHEALLGWSSLVASVAAIYRQRLCLPVPPLSGTHTCPLAALNLQTLICHL